MAMPRKPVTFTGSSPLAPLMAQFIQEKRACGYRYDSCAGSLRRFDAHPCRQGLQHVELPSALRASGASRSLRSQTDFAPASLPTPQPAPPSSSRSTIAVVLACSPRSECPEFQP